MSAATKSEIESRITAATAAIATHGWRADGETEAGRIAQGHLDAATVALQAAQAELAALVAETTSERRKLACMDLAHTLARPGYVRIDLDTVDMALLANAGYTPPMPTAPTTSTIPGKNGTLWLITSTPDGFRVRHQYPSGDEIDIPSPLDHTTYATEVEALAAIEAL